MYFFFLILLLFVLTGFIFFHKRKKKICRKICSMNFHEKCKTLTELITPFGFCYDSKQDIFSTPLDAWQREFGYTEKYNKLAPYFNMVFDYEPVYFDYNNRTWLIEFWKGQYGINTGCEVGIYYSESIISPDMRNTTLFHCVKDNDMLPISIQLIRDACTLGIIQKKHWWLTVFDVGKYCEPSRLSIPIEITFPNKQMLYSFTQALLEKGYSHNQIYIYIIQPYTFYITQIPLPHCLYSDTLFAAFPSGKTAFFADYIYGLQSLIVPHWTEFYTFTIIFPLLFDVF